MFEEYSNYCIPQIHKTALKKLMQDVTTILDQNNITYWVDGGSLLGCVRHHGQIPHDDDIDLAVFDKDYYKLPKLFSTFQERGYKIQYIPQVDEMIKIFVPDQWITNDYRDFGTPTLDIFPWSRSKDIVRLYSLKHRYQWADCWHENKDLFPLKKYQYDDFEVWGPNDPIPYLDRMYEDWQKLVVVEVRKGTNKSERLLFDMEEVKSLKDLHSGTVESWLELDSVRYGSSGGNDSATLIAS